MRRTANARGSALTWAMLVLALTAIACTAIADGLARRSRLLRQQVEAAAMADLARSARAAARAYGCGAGWSGSLTIELAGGTITLARDAGDAAGCEAVVRSRLTGRERRESAPLR